MRFGQIESSIQPKHTFPTPTHLYPKTAHLHPKMTQLFSELLVPAPTLIFTRDQKSPLIPHFIV